jgi:hypothetical protein
VCKPALPVLTSPFTKSTIGSLDSVTRDNDQLPPQIQRHLEKLWKVSI